MISELVNPTKKNKHKIACRYIQMHAINESSFWGAWECHKEKACLSPCTFLHHHWTSWFSSSSCTDHSTPLKGNELWQTKINHNTKLQALCVMDLAAKLLLQHCALNSVWNWYSVFKWSSYHYKKYSRTRGRNWTLRPYSNEYLNWQQCDDISFFNVHALNKSAKCIIFVSMLSHWPV